MNKVEWDKVFERASELRAGNLDRKVTERVMARAIDEIKNPLLTPELIVIESSK